MAAMQHQIEEFVSTLNDQLTSQAGMSPREKRGALIPVINLPPLAQRSKAARER